MNKHIPKNDDALLEYSILISTDMLRVAYSYFQDDEAKTFQGCAMLSA